MKLLVFLILLGCLNATSYFIEYKIDVVEVGGGFRLNSFNWVWNQKVKETVYNGYTPMSVTFELRGSMLSEHRCVLSTRKYISNEVIH